MFEWQAIEQGPPQSNALLLFYRSCGEYLEEPSKNFDAIVDEFDDIVAFKILSLPPDVNDR